MKSVAKPAVCQWRLSYSTEGDEDRQSAPCLQRLQHDCATTGCYNKQVMGIREANATVRCSHIQPPSLLIGGTDFLMPQSDPSCNLFGLALLDRRFLQRRGAAPASRPSRRCRPCQQRQTAGGGQQDQGEEGAIHRPLRYVEAPWLKWQCRFSHALLSMEPCVRFRFAWKRNSW